MSGKIHKMLLQQLLSFSLLLFENKSLFSLLLSEDALSNIKERGVVIVVSTWDSSV